MITAVPIRPKIDEFQSFNEKTRFLLVTHPKEFLNQSLYDSTIITLLQKCQLEELELLSRLCSLNSKRFLPFWGMVIDKYRQNCNKEEFFALLVSMTFNIGPFIDGTSSKRTNLSKLSYETLSQSINRYLNFLLDECESYFETSQIYLTLYRKIISNTNRHLEDLDKLALNVLSLMRERMDDPELSKFICLLIKRFNINISLENFNFLVSLNNSYITKALVRKQPLRFDDIGVLGNEILGEYCLAILENSLIDPNILCYLERLKNEDQFIKQLIIIPCIKDEKILHYIAAIVKGLYPFLLPELIKYTEQGIIKVLINEILDKEIKTESDWEAVANSLNRLDDGIKFVGKIDTDDLSFQKLRCHLSLVKTGLRYGMDSFRDRFIQSCDPKELIILSLIFLQLQIPIDQQVIEQKMIATPDSRLIKHLRLLIEMNIRKKEG